jgi:3-phosphoshikimate 1-carboxyvinyltransferase
MAKRILLKKRDNSLLGTINLSGSKSISNRVLIIRALCSEFFPIEGLASANDTELLQQLIQSNAIVRDAGPAGTTFRFMTAYLSMQPGTQVLTGTERMKQRPVRVLVDALRTLGANIEYLEKEGYPPLSIGESTLSKADELEIDAGTSSQYLSALLMIAPTLPNGLRLKLKGALVSRPYLLMTLRLMEFFGVQYHWEGNVISVAAQSYQAKPYKVEADWSAASYYYIMAAFSDQPNLFLGGLFEDSLQGDAVIAEMMESFGIESTFNENGVRLTRKGASSASEFRRNFLECPDIAQSLAVICGGTGRHGYFSGLQTLKIKETDRIAALHQELKKVGVHFALEPIVDERGEEQYEVKGKANWRDIPHLETYEDHRMAMAFAPLAMLEPIIIEDPKVVVKSYPEFWEDLKQLDFEVIPQD